MPKEWKKPKPTEGQRAKAASDAKKTIARFIWVFGNCS